MLESLLQRHIGRPVSEPDDKQWIQPRRVYVAPADYHLLVEDSHFALSVDAASSSRGRRSTSSSSPSPRPIATARSGSCSRARTTTAPRLDAIKERGRLVVQDPQTAERREMPDAAIARSAVDAVLPLEQIGPFLFGLCRP